MWLVGGPVTTQAQAMPGDPSHIEQDQADEGVICVALSGDDIPACGTEGTPCLTVQYAVDKALPGDEIRVAAGTYTGVNDYGSLSQIVHLTKSLTIRGGYTTENWTTPDPDANPTTLDAEGEGRVMVIQPGVVVNLEGLRFQGGNATGLGGGPDNKDAGGGLYILTATVTISNCVIMSNTGSITGTVPGGDLGGGLGGGLYAREGFTELIHNDIVSNTAGADVYGHGGGIYLDHGNAVLTQNRVMSNTASLREVGYGGGLYLYGGVPPDPFPSASLLDNTLQGNYASRQSDGQGGAMYAYHYDLELLDNLIQHNIGGGPGQDSRGGGLYIFWSNAWLRDNQVLHNTASGGKEGISGGVHFCTCSSTTVILENNTILGNTANTFGNGYGGGVSFCKTTATLDSNAIISNTATLSTTDEVLGWGGGVWTGDRASVSFNNDLIAGNHAKTQGSGLWLGVETEPTEPEERPTIRLQHVTIADNIGGSGHGVCVLDTVAFLTNTIIAGHTYGVVVEGEGEATLEATLWYDNKWKTNGAVETGDLNYDGDPAFVDPARWDYHIGAGSPALDRGVATGVHSDMDGQRRPWLAPDLGADEIWPDNVFIRAYLPLILRQSSQ